MKFTKLRRRQSVFTMFGLSMVAFFIAIITGWVLNIVDVVSLLNAGTYDGMLVFRIVGVFFVPLGTILGFI